MTHRIRHAMESTDTTPMGSGGGVVEADEIIQILQARRFPEQEFRSVANDPPRTVTLDTILKSLRPTNDRPRYTPSDVPLRLYFARSGVGPIQAPT